VLKLAEEGNRLMLDSLDVVADLKRRCAGMIGASQLTAVLGGLSAFITQAEAGQAPA
jgi:hypothetical protein